MYVNIAVNHTNPHHDYKRQRVSSNKYISRFREHNFSCDCDWMAQYWKDLLKITNGISFCSVTPNTGTVSIDSNNKVFTWKDLIKTHGNVATIATVIETIKNNAHKKNTIIINKRILLSSQTLSMYEHYDSGLLPNNCGTLWQNMLIPKESKSTFLLVI